MGKLTFIGGHIEDTSPIDENTLLLLHGEDIADGSMYGHLLTNYGVAVAAEQSKFGGGSLYFDGNSYLTVIDEVFIMGTGDFTIDWWEYRTVSGVGSSVSFNVLSNDGRTNFLLAHKGTQVFSCSTASVWWDVVGGVSVFTEKLNTWSHKALVRKESGLYVFDDGVLTYQQSITADFSTGEGKVYIGRHADDASPDFLTGYIDEFRVSNVARWTSDFTPESEAYRG